MTTTITGNQQGHQQGQKEDPDARKKSTTTITGNQQGHQQGHKKTQTQERSRRRR